MAKITYEEIGFSEKTGNETVKHLWDWNKDSKILSHYVDGEFQEEFKGSVADKMLKSIMT